jgi:hypothetical protein
MQRVPLSTLTIQVAQTLQQLDNMPYTKLGQLSAPKHIPSMMSLLQATSNHSTVALAPRRMPFPEVHHPYLTLSPLPRSLQPGLMQQTAT